MYTYVMCVWFAVSRQHCRRAYLPHRSSQNSTEHSLSNHAEEGNRGSSDEALEQARDSFYRQDVEKARREEDWQCSHRVESKLRFCRQQDEDRDEESSEAVVGDQLAGGGLSRAAEASSHHQEGDGRGGHQQPHAGR